MNSSRSRLFWLAVLASLVALLGAACSSSNDNKTATSGSSPSQSSDSGSSSDDCNTTGQNIDDASLSGTLNGQGSTFQDAFNQKAKSEFASAAPNVTVNYQANGSKAGRQALASTPNDVQFAGSDTPIPAADKASFPGTVLYFPTVAAPITVSYNLPGTDQLKLSADTLAGIFSTTIKTWNDPKIAADNPGTSLPSTAIAVVHRNEGSGTTTNFATYLTKAAPTTWTLGDAASGTLNWPAGTQGGDKNAGVASIIKSTQGAVGYVVLSDAVNSDLQFASIKNSSGQFVQPTLEAASAALAGATINPDLTYNPLNAPGADAYPITSPTWILVYAKQSNAGVASALKGWLNFILTQGQTFANDVGYASLPCSLAQQAVTQLNQITT